MKVGLTIFALLSYVYKDIHLLFYVAYQEGYLKLNWKEISRKVIEELRKPYRLASKEPRHFVDHSTNMRMKNERKVEK